MTINSVDSFYNASYNTTLPVEWRRNSWTAAATGASLEIMASSWLVNGTPGCATATPATGAGETCDRTTPGALPMPTEAVGESIYIQHMNLASLAYGAFKLYDRLWHNSGLNGSTITPTEQTITGVALPARAGNYVGVMPFAEVYAITGTPTTTNVTLRYLNQAGVEKTATTTGVVLSSVGRFIPLNLAAGDTGVSQVLGVTLSANVGVSNTVNWGITLARFVLIDSSAGANWATEPKNSLNQGGPKVDDNACLFVAGMWGVAQTNTSVHGVISLVRG